MTGPITDGQLGWIRNNQIGFDVEDMDRVESLTKEQAFDIINRAKSQGYTKFSSDLGVIKFWKDIKDKIHD